VLVMTVLISFKWKCFRYWRRFRSPVTSLRSTLRCSQSYGRSSGQSAQTSRMLQTKF